jgi:uncharacterized protein (DUF302 family)
MNAALRRGRRDARPLCNGPADASCQIFGTGMMRWKILSFAALAAATLGGTNAMAADGLITLPSAYPAKETADRLAADATAKGLTLFARIDHAAGAAAAGLGLRPTELLIFGNAKGGTPLMQAEQTIGIDLPLKALVWQDATGKTWLSYSDPAWLASRHGLGPETAGVTGTLSTVLGALAHKATAAP